MEKERELNSINKRLKFFIEKHLKTSVRQFALSLDKVDQSIISNIVSGRLNKPSSDLYKKIKNKYPEINLEWLIMGEGEMLKNEDTKKFVNMDEKNEEQIVIHKGKEHEKKLMSPIIQRIRMLRINAGYTNKEIAKKLGLSLTAYAAIEQEKVFFSVPKLILLCKIYKKSYNYILNGIDQAAVPNKNIEEKEREIALLEEIIDGLKKQIELLGNKK